MFMNLENVPGFSKEVPEFQKSFGRLWLCVFVGIEEPMCVHLCWLCVSQLSEPGSVFIMLCIDLLLYFELIENYCIFYREKNFVTYLLDGHISPSGVSSTPEYTHFPEVTSSIYGPLSPRSCPPLILHDAGVSFSLSGPPLSKKTLRYGLVYIVVQLRRLHGDGYAPRAPKKS